MNWWRSRRPHDPAPEPAALRHPESETAAPRPDATLRLQRDLGNRAVQKLVPQSAGEPIAEDRRAELEGAFGAGLEDVRVHRDDEARDLAAGVGANAFATGRDIYFAPGAYTNEALAHEVTHVIQQSRSPSVVSGENAQLEEQANAASSSFLASRPVEISGASAAPALQRQPAPGTQGSALTLLPSDSVTLDGFDVDKADLSAAHKQKLDGFAKRLKAALASSPNSIVTIVGYADAPGSEPHNLALGQHRADAARDYLVSKGVSADQLHASSLGEALPVVATKGYEARNRRVEIDVIERTFFKSPPAAPPPAPATPQPAEKPKIDLTFHPKEHEPDPSQEMQDRWRLVDQAVREAQEAEKRNAGTSVADATGRILRNAAKKLGLPEWLQDRAESIGKDLPSKGAQSAVDQIAGDRNMDANTKNALKALVDALMRLKVK